MSKSRLDFKELKQHEQEYNKLKQKKDEERRTVLSRSQQRPRTPDSYQSTFTVCIFIFN